MRVLPFTRTPEARDGILPHRRQPGTNDLIGWESDDGAVTVEARAGSVVAFSSLLLHATGANQTEHMRRVYLAQYTAEPMLEKDRRQLRRNAIALVRRGEQVTFA